MNEETKQKITELFGNTSPNIRTKEMVEQENEFRQDEEIRKQQVEEDIRLGKTRQQIALDDYGEWVAGLDIEPETWSTNEHDLLMQDKDYRQKMYKKAMHDYAYLDSTEHHIVDMLEGIGNPDTQEILTIDEARQYAKEKGVEWNSNDKETVTKYELDKQINRELLRRNLEQEIAEYGQYKDYTKWDNISRIGSAISGGVGAIETAATIGLGLLTGPGIVAALGRLGATALEAGNTVRAIHLMQKMQIAQKAINFQRSAIKEMQLTNKAIQITKANRKILKNKYKIQMLQKELGSEAVQSEVKNTTFTNKALYDSMRFGQTGLAGGKASTASVAIPFAIDGMLSDIPREVAQKTYSDMFNTGEYGSKEVVRDLLLAGSLGYLLPWGGSALKAGGKATGFVLTKTGGAIANVGEHISNKLYSKAGEEAAQSYLQGHPYKSSFADTAQSLQEIQAGLKENEKLSANSLNMAQSLQSKNYTEQEFQTELVNAITEMATGERVNSVPPRTQWMTTVPNIYDLASTAEKQGKSIDEIWDVIKNSGLEIDYSSSWANGKVSTNSIDEFIYRIKSLYLDSKVKFKKEQGYLGTTSVKGITNADTEDLFKNFYIAHLLPETEVGKLAKQNLQDYHNHLAEVIEQINKIKSRYEIIVNTNKTKNYSMAQAIWEESTGTKYVRPKFSALDLEQQRKIYPLMSGEYGNLTEAVREILIELLPKDMRERYREGKQLLMNIQQEETLKGGHIDISTLSQKQELEATIGNVDRILDSLVSENSLFIKQSSKTYFDTGKPITVEFEDLTSFEKGKSALTGEAKATRSARLEYMGRQLEEILSNNEKLLNADTEYQKLLPDPNEMLQPQEEKVLLDVSEAERLHQKAVGDLAVENVIKSDSSKVERFNTERVVLENKLQNEQTKTLFDNILQNFQKETSAKRRVAQSMLDSFMDGMKNLDSVLKEDFTPIRNVLIEKLKTSEIFNEILENPNYGKISETSAMWKIPKYRNEFKRIVKESLKQTINSDGKYTKIFGDKFERLLDDSMDSFDTYIKENMDDGLKKIATPHDYNAEVNTKEEIAKEIAAQTEREQIIDSILTPYFEKLSYEAMDLQAENYREMSKILDTIELFHAYPGQIDEIVLGQITMSPTIARGSSLSAEAVSQLYSEITQFKAALERNDNAAIRDNIIPQAIATSKSFESLHSYAMNPENMPAIKEALFDRLRFINGEMTEEEVKLFNRQSNTRAARVAKEYMNVASNLKQMLYNVGSNKNRIVQLLDPSKLKSPRLYLSLNKTSGKYANAIRSYTSSSNPAIYEATRKLNRFIIPLSKDRESLADCNMALDLFEKLDLDKQFNNKKQYSYNAIRDALVSDGGLENYIETQLQERIKTLKIKDAALIEEEKNKIIANVKKACDSLSDEFFGVPGQDIGYINRLKGDVSYVQDPLSTSFRARYVEDIQPKFFYKNTEYEKQDLQRFGYDNLKSMFESNMGTAKKAYAVLSTFGNEPVKHITMIKEIAKEYANTIAPKTLGFEKADLIKRKLNATWERSVDFNLHNVCGTYTVPANMFQKWAQIIVRTASAPMLMNAGFRSATDYNYQMQSLITMGLASEGDLQARRRIVGQALSRFTADKDLTDRIFISEMLRDETLYSMAYNSSLGTGDILKEGFKDVKGIKAIKKIVTDPYMTKTEKAEVLSRRYTDVMLNTFAWIGPMTSYNRGNAAVTTMRAIGDYAPTRYAQMPKRLQQTLTRFGISDYEWDNILSKYVVTNSKDYIEQMTEGAVKHELSNYNMFFPELVDKIPEKDLTKMMQDQKLPITDMSKARYRQYLKDKASLLINSSADEMTSIPTSRIQGAMSFHNLPNTGVNFFLNTFLQFQSFGAAINYYQWGRRLASYQTPDNTFNHLLCAFSGHPSDSLTMAQFIAESALVEFFVGEVLREVKGTNRRLVNDRKEFQTEAAIEKTADALGGTLGLGNMLIQTILSKFMKSTGQGGGLSIPALPALSTLLQKVERISSAATKKSTENNRGQAIAGAVGEDIADVLGFPNNPIVHSAWGLIIGDTFKEWQQGDRASAIKTQRLHRGYTPSLARHIAETTGIIDPNETSLYSQFTD